MKPKTENISHDQATPLQWKMVPVTDVSLLLVAMVTDVG